MQGIKNPGDICTTHESCDGTESDCRDSSGLRPGTGRGVLTADTVTRHQIRGLANEAFERGDIVQFDLCTAALLGSAVAIAACAETLSAGRVKTPAGWLP